MAVRRAPLSRILENLRIFLRYVALGVGAGSLAMVATTATIVACGLAGPRQKAGNEGLAAALRGDAAAPSEGGVGHASDVFGVAMKQRKTGINDKVTTARSSK